MPDPLAGLLAVEGVRGVLLYRPGGELLFRKMAVSVNGGSTADWFALALALGTTREAEILFERGRVYVFRSASAVLLVLAGLFAPSAVIRMSSAVLSAELEGALAPKRGAGDGKPAARSAGAGLSSPRDLMKGVSP